jgi:hypothetical protein
VQIKLSYHLDFWNKYGNVLAYMEWVADKLGITDMEDWKNVSVEQLSVLHGGGLVKKMGGITELLEYCFPSISFIHSFIHSFIRSFIKLFFNELLMN